MPGREPGGTYRNRATVDGLRTGLAEYANCIYHVFDVCQRLSHTLKHDAVHALKLRPIQPAPDRPHLLDDFPDFQVSDQAHFARGTKTATETTSGLRTDAHRKPAGSLQRNPDGLHGMAVWRQKSVSHKGINPAGMHRSDGKSGQDACSAHSFQAVTANHLDEPGQAILAVDGTHNLAGFLQRDPGDGFLQSVRRGCLKINHAILLICDSVSDPGKSIFQLVCFLRLSNWGK